MWHLLEPTAETPRWDCTLGAGGGVQLLTQHRRNAQIHGRGARGRLPSVVTGVASDGTARGLVPRAAKCSGAPGAGEG